MRARSCSHSHKRIQTSEDAPSHTVVGRERPAPPSPSLPCRPSSSCRPPSSFSSFPVVALLWLRQVFRQGRHAELQRCGRQKGSPANVPTIVNDSGCYIAFWTRGNFFHTTCVNASRTRSKSGELARKTSRYRNRWGNIQLYAPKVLFSPQLCETFRWHRPIVRLRLFLLLLALLVTAFPLPDTLARGAARRLTRTLSFSE